MQREFDRYECMILTSGLADSPQRNFSIAQSAVTILERSLSTLFASLVSSGVCVLEAAVALW